MSDPLAVEKKELLNKFFVQLQVGCGRPLCTSECCRSNPNCKEYNKQEAIVKALELTRMYYSDSNEKPQLCTPVPQYLTLPIIQKAIELSKVTNDFKEARQLLATVFSNPEAPNISFLLEGKDAVSTAIHSGVDSKAVQEAFKNILDQEELRDIFESSLERLILNINQDLRTNRDSFDDINNLRQFILLLNNPTLYDPSTYKSYFRPLCACIRLLPDSVRPILTNWIIEFDDEYIVELVKFVQTFISMQALETKLRDDIIRDAVHFLEILNSVNKAKGEIIPYTEFYNDVINEELNDSRRELVDNYIDWHKPARFSLCKYPFILTPLTKSKLLRFDSKEQQINQRRGSLRGLISPYLVLEIDREHLIQTAMIQIEQIIDEDPSLLKNELKVRFEGEEGIDEGGVQKEFFQLIIRQIFDEKYGMFTLQDNHTYWFSHTSDELKEFELIGVIVGLAIFNQVILDIQFPFAVYKKIMGLPISFDDLKDVSPRVYANLQSLLKYNNPDFEETFLLNFQAAYEYYGSTQTVDLKENGADIPVTNDNKHEYITLYSSWLLEKSIEKQFDAFLKGFRHVCSDSAFFDLFRAEEVEALVCGESELDFEDLEKVTYYDNGYSADHKVIKYFWNVLHSFTQEEKKQFMAFTTGCYRAPIGGLSNSRLVVVRHGEDSDKLPQAHTCFNVLLLPEYSTEEKLRNRILLAINNAEGFGML